MIRTLAEAVCPPLILAAVAATWHRCTHHTWRIRPLTDTELGGPR